MTASGEADPPLEVEISTASDSVAVRLAGDLDMESAPRLTAAFERIFAASPKEVEVDLADLEFLDSTGVRVLLNALATALEMGATLIARRPQPLVARVLHISGIAEYLGLPPTAT